MCDNCDVLTVLATLQQRIDDAESQRAADLCADDFVLRSATAETIGRTAFASLLEQRARAGWHLMSNSAVAIEGSRARITSDYVFVERTGDGVVQIAVVGRFHDALRKDPVWLMSSRTIEVAYPVAAE